MNVQYAQRQYVNTQIKTADRLKLVVMLYEGAISFLRQAKTKMENNDIAGRGVFIGKAQDIILELDNSLNLELGGEIASNLRKLYGFMNRYLTKTIVKWDPQAIERVIHMLSQLKEAWEEISLRPQAEIPIAQKRPAGNSVIARQVF